MICLPAYIFADWCALSFAVSSDARGNLYAFIHGPSSSTDDGTHNDRSYMLNIYGGRVDWSYIGIDNSHRRTLDQSSIWWFTDTSDGEQ